MRKKIFIICGNPKGKSWIHKMYLEYLDAKEDQMINDLLKSNEIEPIN